MKLRNKNKPFSEIKTGRKRMKFDISANTTYLYKYFAAKVTRTTENGLIIPKLALENINENNLIGRISREDQEAMSPIVFHSNTEVMINKYPHRKGVKRILLNGDKVEITSNQQLFFEFYDLRQTVNVSVPFKISNRYYIEKSLRKGCSGAVFLVHDIRSCNKFAMKFAKKSSHDVPTDYAYEAKLMLKLDHPNIIKLLRVHEELKYSILFTEFMNRQDLLDVIFKSENKRLPEDLSKHVMLQIVNGLSYLHEMNICHRDLKCENIFVKIENEKIECKIGDFGLASFDISLSQICGTLRYSPPELVANNARGKIYEGKKVDIWNLGIVLYCVLSGRFPFYNKDEKEVRHQILNKRLVFQTPEIWSNISYNARRLIQAMVNKTPSYRYTIQEVSNHEWFQSIKPSHKVTQKRKFKYRIPSENCIFPHKRQKI